MLEPGDFATRHPVESALTALSPTTLHCVGFLVDQSITTRYNTHMDSKKHGAIWSKTHTGVDYELFKHQW